MPETEALSQKKQIYAGHRATCTLGQITTALAETSPDPDRLSLLKLTLNEKLEILKGFDAEMIALTPRMV